MQFVQLAKTILFWGMLITGLLMVTHQAQSWYEDSELPVKKQTSKRRSVIP